MSEKLLEIKEGPAFDTFVYTRPDLAELESTLEKCRQDIADDVPVSEILKNIETLYSQYDSFYTNLNLADIHYCMDMSNSYWAEEYNYCDGLASEVEAKLEQLYEILAASQYRQKLESDIYFGAGFFNAYTGESYWDETYLALALEESNLQAEYNDILAEAGNIWCYSPKFYDAYGYELAQILVDLIRVRQQIADHIGAVSYEQLSYESVYGREYSAREAKQYLRNAGTAMSHIYGEIYDDKAWRYGEEVCNPEEAFAYVEQTANYLGGNVKKAFDSLECRELYDLSYSSNKFDGSYCVYLTDYNAPFVFVNPWNQAVDKLTFAHEFGHFTNEYICGGSYVGTDISEIQSQGMEYFSLCCSKDPGLTRYKMADSLSVYVHQSAYGLFELEIYELEGEELTVENVIACYRQICEDFSVVQDDWNEFSFVNVSHFYLNPMYIVSYVVSNDLAMQFYEMELENPGKGKKYFVESLSSEEMYILDFADQYGLKNPFSEERIAELKCFFEETLLSLPQAA